MYDSYDPYAYLLRPAGRVIEGVVGYCIAEGNTLALSKARSRDQYFGTSVIDRRSTFKIQRRRVSVRP